MKIIPSVFWMLLICSSFPVWSQTEVNEVTESTEVEVEKKPEPRKKSLKLKIKNMSPTSYVYHCINRQTHRVELYDY